MRRVNGTADPSVLTALEGLAGDMLAEAAGASLARLHRIRPADGAMADLPAPAADPALARIGELRATLDAMAEAQPALEWGLRWLERHAPPPAPIVLTHGDFRTGNLMVERGEGGTPRLSAVLDWEFAGWSDGHEDIGWLTALCWRFERRDRPVGGFGDLAAFARGYAAVGGAPIDPDLPGG
jgi:aminoglycoside phosphotransferase (APT) family kinase protein